MIEPALEFLVQKLKPIDMEDAVLLDTFALVN
jgi:hypothetical protein